MADYINLVIDKNKVSVKSGITGNIYFKNSNVIILRINGILRDLDTEFNANDQIESIDIKSEEGLNVLRHSTAHVLAQAVQKINPEANLGIGPYIQDGFYYDFEVQNSFKVQDLKNIEKVMQKIIQDNQQFSRRIVSKEEAKLEFKDEPYKLNLLLNNSDKIISIYDNINSKNKEVIWKDLCKGPHLPSTKLIGDGFSLMKSSSAYWLGKQDNPELQRIYGTAWPSKKELSAYKKRIIEAENNDHRKIGKELDLFSFPEEIGPGLPVFHPKGGMMRKSLEDYSKQCHLESGYEFVYTPHITKGQLFHTSGHLSFYKENMFPSMTLKDAPDNQEYFLKPMNCPMHNLIYRSRSRSYRELPLRFFEFGSVYRYEKSGVINGLTRVRGMTQDDAHIYCTKDQMKQEIIRILQFILKLLKDFGLDDFLLEISTKNEEKFVGSELLWDEATKILYDVAKESKIKFVVDANGAAFYGPKISVQIKDAIGRRWQVSTIQLDFNLPQKFNLTYQAEDGTKKQVVMIHRALFGSIERFLGILIEHYKGFIPPWLCPTQVMIVPVVDIFNSYAFKILNILKSKNIRSDIDISNQRFSKKIRTNSKLRYPFIIIVGQEDERTESLSFRFRDGSQMNNVPIIEGVEFLRNFINSRKNYNPTGRDFIK